MADKKDGRSTDGMRTMVVVRCRSDAIRRRPWGRPRRGARSSWTRCRGSPWGCPWLGSRPAPAPCSPAPVRVSQIKTRTSSSWPDKRKQCNGSGIFIPDPAQNFFYSGSRVKKTPGSRIQIHIIIKELKYFNPKIVSISRNPDPRSGSWFFTHFGSRIQGSKRHRIPDPQHREKGQQKLINRHSKFSRIIYIKLGVLSRGLGFLID